MIEPPPPLPFEPHPLVALPRPLKPGAIDLPRAFGQAPQTGALSQATLHTTQAIAEALFSNEGQAPPADRVQWLMHEYADFMSRANGRGRLMFTAAAVAISIIAPLMGRRRPPFRRLSLAERIVCLQALDSSVLSPLLLALKAILCMIYYEHPEPAREAGMSLGPKVAPHE